MEVTLLIKSWMTLNCVQFIISPYAEQKWLKTEEHELTDVPSILKTWSISGLNFDVLNKDQSNLSQIFLQMSVLILPHFNRKHPHSGTSELQLEMKSLSKLIEVPWRSLVDVHLMCLLLHSFTESIQNASGLTQMEVCPSVFRVLQVFVCSFADDVRSYPDWITCSSSQRI